MRGEKLIFKTCRNSYKSMASAYLATTTRNVLQLESKNVIECDEAMYSIRTMDTLIHQTERGEREIHSFCHT